MAYIAAIQPGIQGASPKTFALPSAAPLSSSQFVSATTSPSSPASQSPSRSPSQLTPAHTSFALTSSSPSSSSHAVPTGMASTLSPALIVPSLGFRATHTTAFFDPGPRLGWTPSCSGPWGTGWWIISPVDITHNRFAGMYASGWTATAIGVRGVLLVRTIIECIRRCRDNCW